MLHPTASKKELRFLSNNLVFQDDSFGDRRRLLFKAGRQLLAVDNPFSPSPTRRTAAAEPKARVPHRSNTCIGFMVANSRSESSKRIAACFFTLVLALLAFAPGPGACLQVVQPQVVHGVRAAGPGAHSYTVASLHSSLRLDALAHGHQRRDVRACRVLPPTLED